MRCVPLSGKSAGSGPCTAMNSSRSGGALALPNAIAPLSTSYASPSGGRSSNAQAASFPVSMRRSNCLPAKPAATLGASDTCTSSAAGLPLSRRIVATMCAGSAGSGALVVYTLNRRNDAGGFAHAVATAPITKRSDAATNRRRLGMPPTIASGGRASTSRRHLGDVDHLRRQRPHALGIDLLGALDEQVQHAIASPQRRVAGRLPLPQRRRRQVAERPLTFRQVVARRECCAA